MLNINLIQQQSPNFNNRIKNYEIDMLVLHYTGMVSTKDALERLCNPSTEVSAHYLIDLDGTCFQLVEETSRAWHAGKSRWAGNTDINSRSIGIELVNPGHQFGYTSYSEAQMESLESLSNEILTRYPIPPRHVLGHSDVAPSRRQDPGELLDWRRLATAGIGLWSNETLTIVNGRKSLGPGATGKEVSRMQEKLAYFGYGVPTSGAYDKETCDVVMAFQRHFRPEKVDGLFDSLCLRRLLDLLRQIE